MPLRSVRGCRESPAVVRRILKNFCCTEAKRPPSHAITAREIKALTQANFLR
jgi:hypothetical protein